jgi:hypothetical protein
VVVKRNTTESVEVKEEDEDITIISESFTKSTPARINKASSFTNRSNSSVTNKANPSVTNKANSSGTNNANSSGTNNANSSGTNNANSSGTKHVNSSGTNHSEVIQLFISEFSSLANSSTHSSGRKQSGVTVKKLDSITKPNNSHCGSEKKDLLPSLLLQPKSKPLNGVVKNNNLEITEIETKQKPRRHIVPKKVIEPIDSNETKERNVNEVRYIVFTYFVTIKPLLN